MNVEDRIGTSLKKQLGKRGWDFSGAPDWRQQGKVKVPVHAALYLMLIAMMRRCETLRDVENVGGKLGGWLRGIVPMGASDTTLDSICRKLDHEYLRGQLCQQIRDLHRSKSLKPVGVTAGIAVVDGKNLATLDHDAGGTGHKRSKDNEKWHDPNRPASAEYWLMPALRATLSSAASRPCIYQLPLPPGRGECAAFSAFMQGLVKEYGRTSMIQVIDADAGLCSLSNANLVHDLGYFYILGLKGNQPDLFEAAQLVLYERMGAYAPDAETDWERRSGKRVRRRLWRSVELKDFENSVGTWHHLQQVWLVRQETMHADGRIEVEDRFFVTSIPWHHFSPNEIISIVRRHWAVENDTFNSLDLQWREDSAPWCTKGSAIWGLGILRIMAYNFVQHLRRRRLCRRRPNGTYPPPIPWRQVFELVRDTVTLVSYGAITNATCTT